MPRSNNFDLIRLLAALQVLFMHSVAWLELPVHPMLAEILDWFPGVPIFFMISGLLITHSFVRLPTVWQFLQHRALRIYPALWVCLAVSFLLSALQGGLTNQPVFQQTVAWVALQGSFFQFVNFWGNPGVTNGVLWSISTELQFYLLLPVVVACGRRFLRDKVGISIALIFFAVVSASMNHWTLAHQTELLPRMFPTLYASILSNGYLFAFGVLAYLWRERLLGLCAGRFWRFAALYLVVRASLQAAGVGVQELHTTMWALLVYPLLGLATYAFAHSFRGIAARALRGNDFSYGIYIYHMPVMYASMYLGWTGAPGLAAVTVGVALLAALSWFGIERPILRLKRETPEPTIKETHSFSAPG